MVHKRISVDGATGAIGRRTIGCRAPTAQRDIVGVVEELNRIEPNSIEVIGITCNRNVWLLAEQINRCNPRYAAVVDRSMEGELRRLVKKGCRTEIASGEEAAIEACGSEETEMVVAARVGISGLRPTLEYIRRGKDIGLANKETLITGGKIVTEEAKRRDVQIIPIDSEHSAILQAARGNADGVEGIEKLLITCSGGPFYGRRREQLYDATVEQALGHPTWDMGKKITIDSATLMNKGFEVMEAGWLFGIDQDRIEVVIHRQSLVHSMVQFVDGSIVAQIGTHDMRTPIQYALTYPRRQKNEFPRLDFSKDVVMEFYGAPDKETFKCFAHAMEAMGKGGNYPTVLNGANEQANLMFREKEIGFLDIADLVGEAIKRFDDDGEVSLDSIMAADRAARDCVADVVEKSTNLHGYARRG